MLRLSFCNLLKFEKDGLGTKGAWGFGMRFSNVAKIFALAVGVTAGCSSGEPEPDMTEDALKAPSNDEKRACEVASIGTDGTGARVVHCTKPFASAPFVRLPADKITGTKATFYGGMTVPSTFEDVAVIWARDGKRYVAVDGEGKAIAFTKAGNKLPAALHAPTNRITFTLYQFTGTLGTEVDTPYGTATAIKLSNARAAVVVDGCGLDSRMLGTWNGTVSEKLETPVGNGPFAKSFDEGRRVPIHLTLTSIKKSNPLADYAGGEPLEDASTFILEGKIDNFSEAINVGGKEYPSLAAMGRKNPFLGASDGNIQLYRLGNMHGQKNDGHWVLTYPKGAQALTGNGMSLTLTALTAPSMILEPGVAAGPLDSLEIRPHIPFLKNGHSVILSAENIGASIGRCE